jgi:cellulose synthase/poly-beta-1,6-N-acetylglucosamine synthase-like glycosyltransferase
MGTHHRSGVLAALKYINAWTNLRQGWLLLVGLVGVSLFQTRLWQRDKALLVSREVTQPLPPVENWPKLPKVTALVAAWNEGLYIEEHIESFLALRYPDKQLVLVAGGDDGTLEMARRYACAQVKIMEQQPGEGKQSALRRGLELVEGEIIYLTDADCRMDNDSFEIIIWPIANGIERITSGSSRPFIEDVTNPFIVSQAVSQIYSAIHMPRYAPGLLGRNCAIERQLLNASSGLDLPALSGTDYVLAKALLKGGAKIRHLPDSQVESEYPRRLKAYFHQQQRWITNVWREGRRFNAPDEARTVLRNALAGLAMLTLPISAWWLGRFIVVIWVILLYNGVLNRVRYGMFVKQMTNIPFGFKDWVRSPFYLLLDCSVWAGSLLAFLRKKEYWE